MKKKTSPIKSPRLRIALKVISSISELGLGFPSASQSQYLHQSIAIMVRIETSHLPR